MKLSHVLVLAVIFLSSCLKERIEGNGHIVSEVRSLSNFTGVENHGSKHIHIAYGADYKVELRGSSNLISIYETEIMNGTLYPHFRNVNVRHDDIEVYITMPAIKRVRLSGSGNISIHGNFPAQDYFEGRIS